MTWLKRWQARALPAGLAALVGLPLVWTLFHAVGAGIDASAWGALLREPQLARAWRTTVFTGLAATLLSLGLSAWILSRSFPGPPWKRALDWLPPMLATPHASFAIGLAFLVAPSGWFLRLLSPWATGFNAPPPWPTTQDPWGMGLVAVLVAKEVPFLLWTAAGQLQRPDVGGRLSRELNVAYSLGYSRERAWWCIVWPQLAPRLVSPALAVLAYSLTVVDMALVIGPTSPPSLAVLAWQWLLDADPQVNAVGAVAAWTLAFTVAVVAGVAWLLLRPAAKWPATPSGKRGRPMPSRPRPFALALLPSLYVSVLLALAVGSVAGVWPFPDLWPQRLSLQAWHSVGDSIGTLGVTLSLGFAAGATALAWSVAWLECASPAWDSRLRQVLYLPLVLPSVLWVVGLHRLTLAWGLDARWPGLWLAHSLAVLPYALIALSPAYLGFDARYGQVTASLGRGRAAFLLGVKWPLLKAALGGAFAVAFAVSVAQYLPTVFIGAGRFATVTTEAVTLASGAQRSLTAAYAWLQWLLPAAVFALAVWFGRPRRFNRRPA